MRAAAALAILTLAAVPLDTDLTLATLPLDTQQTYSADWKRLRSASFTAAGNAGYEDIRAILIELEGFRRVLHDSLASLTLDTAPTLVVFKDDRSFTPFKPRNDRGETRDSIAAYYLSTAQAKYIVVAVHADRRRTYQHLFHEYIHAALQQNLGDVPEWVSEGLAEFYSTLQAQPRTGRTIVGQPSPVRVRTLRAGRLLPLRDVLTYEHRSTLAAPPARVATFYAQSWALVHYLQMSKDGRERPGRLAAYLNELRTGVTVDQAVRNAFGMTVEELDSRLSQYVRRDDYPQVAVEDKGIGQIRTSVEAMLESDVAALHQAMLQAIGRVPAHR